jgi:hypothetical protein
VDEMSCSALRPTEPAFARLVALAAIWTCPAVGGVGCEICARQYGSADPRRAAV